MNGNGGTGTMVGLLDLLLTRAHKVVIVGLLVFFMGPTCLVGFLVWRIVDRQDRAMDMLTNSLQAHMVTSRQDHEAMLKLMQGFIETQRTVELQRNGLLYEMCITLANDGPGRSRCRMAIGLGQ